MLTGKRAFGGDDVSDTLANVLKTDPGWSALPTATPTPICTLLRRCLTRERQQRLQAIGEARIVLEHPAGAEPARVTGFSRSRFGWILAAAACAVLGVAFGFVLFHQKTTAPEVMRFQIVLPAKGNIRDGSVAVSPDGRSIAFVATGLGGLSQLWVRSLDSVDGKPLAVASTALREFWSWDSRSVAFVAERKLKTVNIEGGPPQTLCEMQHQFAGGAWNRDGVILFGSTSGLMRVPATGGEPVPVTRSSTDEVFHGFPAFLADQRHFLYMRLTPNRWTRGIYLGSLDTEPDQQSKQPLTAADWGPVFVPLPGSDAGYLLFMRDGGLMAQPFDGRRLVSKGAAGRVPEDLGFGPFPFSASTGVLAYQSGGASVGRQLTWFDQAGMVRGRVGDPGQYNSVSLSPDGTHVVVSRIEAGNQDLWVYEVARGTKTRLTLDPGVDWLGVWSPKGDQIIFSSSRDGPQNLYQKGSSGASPETPVFRSDDSKFAQDWSHNGQFLLYSSERGNTPNLNLWYLPLVGERKPQLYVTPGVQGQFSPDDRFVAYASDQSGRSEIYVRPFPDSSSNQVTVSRGGGVMPRWRRDGKELFYLSLDSEMMAVDVSTTPAFQAGIPRVLFKVPISGGGTATRYDVRADRTEFLINAVLSDAAGAPPAAITVVLNWPEILKKK
jgi:hypothetical protein